MVVLKSKKFSINTQVTLESLQYQTEAVFLSRATSPEQTNSLRIWKICRKAIYLRTENGAVLYLMVCAIMMRTGSDRNFVSCDEFCRLHGSPCYVVTPDVGGLRHGSRQLLWTQVWYLKYYLGKYHRRNRGGYWNKSWSHHGVDIWTITRDFSRAEWSHLELQACYYTFILSVTLLPPVMPVNLYQLRHNVSLVLWCRNWRGQFHCVSLLLSWTIRFFGVALDEAIVLDESIYWVGRRWYSGVDMTVDRCSGAVG